MEPMIVETSESATSAAAKSGLTVRQRLSRSSGLRDRILNLDSTVDQPIPIDIKGECQSAAADSAEELIRRSSYSTEGDLQVASCLNKLAQVMKNHHKPAESEAIRKRVRNLVARELNRLDGVAE
jgi:hypothetical protein